MRNWQIEEAGFKVAVEREATKSADSPSPILTNRVICEHKTIV